MTDPRCSIVIPTKNAIRTIRPVLQAVVEQVYPAGFETLVVDSGSKDGPL